MIQGSAFKAKSGVEEAGGDPEAGGAGRRVREREKQEVLPAREPTEGIKVGGYLACKPSDDRGGLVFVGCASSVAAPSEDAGLKHPFEGAGGEIWSRGVLMTEKVGSSTYEAREEVGGRDAGLKEDVEEEDGMDVVEMKFVVVVAVEDAPQPFGQDGRAPRGEVVDGPRGQRRRVVDDL